MKSTALACSFVLIICQAACRNYTLPAVNPVTVRQTVHFRNVASDLQCGHVAAEDAEGQIIEGGTRLEAGEVDGAERCFVASCGYRVTWACVVGRLIVFRARGAYADAARLYDEQPTSIQNQIKDQEHDLMESIDARVGRVHLYDAPTLPNPSTVFIDGHPVSIEEAWHYAAPGDHVASVSHSGRTARFPFHVPAGARMQLAVSGPPRPSPSIVESPIFWTSIAVIAAAGGVLIYFWDDIFPRETQPCIRGMLPSMYPRLGEAYLGSDPHLQTCP